MAVWIFWVAAGLVVYPYTLYPILLFAAYSLVQMRRDWQYVSARHDRRVGRRRSEELPAIAVVIAARNEERDLPATLASVLASDYPADKMQVVVVSDGSTDGTNALLESIADPRLRPVVMPKAMGKAHAINVGVGMSTGEVIVLCDASTVLRPGTIEALVRHFADPSMGVVCGYLLFRRTRESELTEGLYWRFESAIRIMETRLGATLTASGALYAVRRTCYTKLEPDVVLDDFVVPLAARRAGVPGHIRSGSGGGGDRRRHGGCGVPPPGAACHGQFPGPALYSGHTHERPHPILLLLAQAPALDASVLNRAGTGRQSGASGTPGIPDDFRGPVGVLHAGGNRCGAAGPQRSKGGTGAVLHRGHGYGVPGGLRAGAGRSTGRRLAESRPVAKPGDDKIDTTIVVLIDALGWRYAEGFLEDMLGVRQRVRTVLGFSSGAIPTILTGRMPAETGHWNLLYYNPAGSRFGWMRAFGWLPDCILDRRVPRKLLKEMGRRLLGMGPLFECSVAPRLLPYFDWVEKRNIYAPGGISGAPSIFDYLTGAGIEHRVYSYHMGRDEALMEMARRDLEARRARFYFIYLSEMDHFLHLHCHQPELVRERLALYQERLSEIFRLALHNDPDVRLAVCSDHGMTPIRDRFDLLGGIAGLGLAMPQDYLAVYDSTMARFWFFHDRARAELLGFLGKQSRGRLLRDEELKELGIWFMDRRFGHAVFLMEPGCVLARSDFHGKGWQPAGMHGFHPDDPESDGVFFSNRPAGLSIRSIADLYEWMRAGVD